MADPLGQGSHRNGSSDPHRWVLQVLGILAVSSLGAFDLATPTDDIDPEIYLIIGGIALGVRPETLLNIWRKGSP